MSGIAPPSGFTLISPTPEMPAQHSPRTLLTSPPSWQTKIAAHCAMLLSVLLSGCSTVLPVTTCHQGVSASDYDAPCLEYRECLPRDAMPSLVVTHIDGVPMPCSSPPKAVTSSIWPVRIYLTPEPHTITCQYSYHYDVPPPSGYYWRGTGTDPRIDVSSPPIIFRVSMARDYTYVLDARARCRTSVDSGTIGPFEYTFAVSRRARMGKTSPTPVATAQYVIPAFKLIPYKGRMTDTSVDAPLAANDDSYRTLYFCAAVADSTHSASETFLKALHGAVQNELQRRGRLASTNTTYHRIVHLVVAKYSTLSTSQRLLWGDLSGSDDIRIRVWFEDGASGTVLGSANLSAHSWSMFGGDSLLARSLAAEIGEIIDGKRPLRTDVLFERYQSR